MGPPLLWVANRKEVFPTSAAPGNTLVPVTAILPGARAYQVAAEPSLRVQILDLGLACCALEVGSAIATGLLVEIEGSVESGELAEVAEGTSQGVGTTILLISGTITDALAPAVLRAWEQLPEPKAAVSFGACANTGGPYWDAPTVTKGIDQVVPVRVYVPGCPPRPEALIAGLLKVRDEIVVA